MSTAVQEVQSAIYSDKSGYFYEGMRRENVKPYKGIKNLFHNAYEDFDMIDSVCRDGILSKDEITNKLHKDIKKVNRKIKANTILAGFWGVAAITSASEKVIHNIGILPPVAFLATAALFTGAALVAHKKQKNLEQKIADAYGQRPEYIHISLKDMLRE